MATEHTLSIIKPDAVSKNNVGQIESRFERGSKIVAMKMIHLNDELAGGFMQNIDVLSTRILWFYDLWTCGCAGSRGR